MNNGYSTIFKSLSANLFAAILFFLGAVISILIGVAGWILGLIMLVISAALFLIERNRFVRRACFILMLLCVLTVVSWLLFRIILPWGFFRALNWIVDIAVALFLIFSGLCALNGKKVDIPFLANLINSVCK